MIIPLSGDDLGITSTENHILLEWRNRGKRVVFSATRHGNAMSCHFSSEKGSIRYLRIAIEEFISFVFDACDWCEMIVANMKQRSIRKLVEKCGFKMLDHLENGTFYYVRER